VTVSMKVSLSGLCKNAARSLDGLLHELCERLTEEELDDVMQEFMPGYYAAGLLELAHHARETKAGKHTAEEFIEHYDIKNVATT
jgi:hypothetical protein